jgi:hypothetical protein
VLVTPGEAAPDWVLARAAELRARRLTSPEFEAEVDLLLRAPAAVYGPAELEGEAAEARMVA